VITDLRGEPLAELRERLLQVSPEPPAIVTCAGDLTDLGFVRELAEATRSHGRLRRLAHVAGVSPSMDDWQRIVDVDLVASARLAKAFRELAGRGAAAVCVASMAGHSAAPFCTPQIEAVIDDPLAPDLLDRLKATVGEQALERTSYVWAKLGVQRLVRREAAAWGAHGARICSVSPGIIDTPMGRLEFEHNPFMADVVAGTPLARSGTADEVAAVIAFLLSDEAAYITGTDVLVDGGSMTAADNPMGAVLDAADASDKPVADRPARPNDSSSWSNASSTSSPPS
jgi:NAD(P)-dependent dehydrogenase (short-subunit alcohol dehydrogenase family)